MNKELLLKVADAIETDLKSDHPDIHFDIRQWVGRSECGTVACVAGYCVAVGDREIFNSLIPPNDFTEMSNGYSSWTIAKEMLDLSLDQAGRLFTPDGMYTTINLKRHLVPDALRWMVLNGKIDWKSALNAATCIRQP